jgi:hypothetical protein
MGVLLALGATLLLIGALLLVVMGLSSLPYMNTDEPLSLLMLAGGMLLMGLLLLPGIVLNARKFFGFSELSIYIPSIHNAILLPVLAIIWIAILVLGQAASSNTTTAILLLPVLNLLAVGLPILAYLRIVLNGLPLPAARRGWSLFGASAITAPLLISIFEAFAFLAFLLLFVLYATTTPGLDTALQSVIDTLQTNRSALDSLTKEFATLLLAPGTTVALLGLFSLAIPIIEEALKIILLWFYADRLRSPVEGFVLGVLCGAAFALVENIGFASTGTSDWTIGVFSRATAALPHIFNCGLMGWALASAWQKKKYVQLFAAYSTAIIVHGTWNALSIAFAFSSLGTFIADIPAIIETPIPAVATWGVLTIGLAAGLFFANHQMRKVAANEAAEDVGYNPPAVTLNSGVGTDNESH